MNVIVQLTGVWKEQLTVFTSQLKKTECAQREQIQAMQEGITKWLAFCTAQQL